MKKYYYLNDGQQIGPLELSELEGKISNTTLIWHDELDEWTEAKNIPELKILEKIPPKIQKTPPPPPLPSNTINEQPIYEEPLQSNKRIYIIAISVFVLLALGIGAYAYFSKPYKAVSYGGDSSPNNYQETETVEDIEKKEAEQRLHDLTIKNREIRNNWSSYIRGDCTYSIEAFGGIINPKITVKNNTEYTIDKITVELSYIKSNGDVYSYEYVTINNIPPKGTSFVYAPNKDRGVKVNTMITEVSSKAFHFCYNIESPSSGIDPYYCK